MQTRKGSGLFDSNYVVRWVEADHFELIRKQWKSLYDKAIERTPFQSVEFYESWLLSRKETGNVFFCLVYNEGDIVGLSVMQKTVLSNGFIDTSVLTPFATPMIDYFLALYSDYQALRVLVRSLQDSPADAVHLEHVPDWSNFAAELALQGIRSVVMTSCPYRDLGELPTCPRVEDIVLSNMKGQILRKTRMLEKLGPVELRVISDASEIADLLLKLVQFHKTRWNSTLTPSMFNDERNVEFYRRQLSLMKSREFCFEMTALYVGSEVAAIHVGYVYDDEVIWLTPTVNPSYSKYSVGMLLATYLVKHSKERGFAKFDFTRGVESYKYDFCHQSRNNLLFFCDLSWRAKVLLPIRRWLRFGKIRDYIRSVGLNRIRSPKGGRIT